MATRRVRVKIVKTPTKRLKKQIKSLRKGLKKDDKRLKLAKKSADKAATKAKKLGSEMTMLKKEMQKLQKKKVARRQLNEYNLFMRKQLKAGKTFKQAVSAWNAFKKLLNKRRPSAYNQFIAAQMRMGKTFKQAVAAWKLFKSGRKPRARTRIVEKIVVRRSKPKVIVRRVRSKPKIVVRRIRAKKKPRRVVRKRTPKKRTFTKRTTVVRESFPSLEKIESIVSKTISTASLQTTIAPADEDVALKMVRLYFQEIARLGFKRSLDLDEIINAYFYSLCRVKRSGIELPEIIEAVKKSKIKKSEF